jgi:hypothetical protein
MGIINENIQKVIEAPVMKIIDEVDSTGNTVYIGYPVNKDARTSEAKWRILKISKSGYVTTFALADGDENYDNVWDNRAALTYTTFA